MLTVKEVLRKRAMGYETEEIKTIVDKKGNGKIEKFKKHVPADISALVLYKRLYGEEIE